MAQALAYKVLFVALSLSQAFSDLDTVFYAIIDRDNFEIGSGIFHAADAESSYPRIERFPFSSNNNNGKVNFGAGIKEVFATYPATNAVYQSSALLVMILHQ